MQLAALGRLRRGRNVLRVAAESLSMRPIEIPGPFFVKRGYSHRDEPAYDDAFRTPGIVWQPGVYAIAAAVGSAVGSGRIVDVGAGNGAKIAGLRGSFDLGGIDFGANLARARDKYPFIHWIERNLDITDDLGVGPELLKGAVVVCADVIEHLRHPDQLMRILRAALDDVACILTSTPDRELISGPAHNGPPPNRGHVREWSRREFAAFLSASGFEHGRIALTQSRSGSPLANTILALLAPSRAALDNASEAALSVGARHARRVTQAHPGGES
jgi:hypothetical protein